MEAIGRLASGVAHDFNNLLTVILGFAELLKEENVVVSANQHGKDVAEIIKAAQRASGLTKQLLAFSRQQVLHATALDVNGLITEMSGMLESLIGEHIDVSLALAPKLRFALADRTQLEQVVLNLVVNARDAMPDGGRLTVKVEHVELDEGAATAAVGGQGGPDRALVEGHAGPYARLSISDTGTGIDEQTRAKLFEPFFTTKEQGKGTGLGLSIVYGIVRQSSGRIPVIREPGRGATFLIYFPTAATPQPAPAPV